jgi:hypothetical protein
MSRVAAGRIQRRLFFAYHKGRCVQCTTFNWPESPGEAPYLRGVFQIKLTNAEMRDGDRVGSKLALWIMIGCGLAEYLS